MWDPPGLRFAIASFRLRRAQAWHIALLQRGCHQLHVLGVHEFHPQKGRQGQVEAIDGAPPGKMWGNYWGENSWDVAGLIWLMFFLGMFKETGG